MGPARDADTEKPAFGRRQRRRGPARIITVGVVAVLLGAGATTALASTADHHSPTRHRRRHHDDDMPTGVVGVTGTDTTQQAFNHDSRTVVTAAPVRVAGDYYFTGQVTVAMGDADQFECQIGNAGTHIFLGSPAATGVFTPSTTSTTVYQTLSLTAWGHLTVGQSAGISCGDTKAGVDTVFAGAQLNGILVRSSRSQVDMAPAAHSDSEIQALADHRRRASAPVMPRLAEVRVLAPR